MRAALFAVVLAVAVVGCAGGRPPAGGTATKPAAAAVINTVTVYDNDRRPDCPHVALGEISERCGTTDIGGRVRLLERLRVRAVGMGGHGIVDLQERMEDPEIVLTGTVIRFVRADCVR